MLLNNFPAVLLPLMLMVHHPCCTHTQTHPPVCSAPLQAGPDAGAAGDLQLAVVEEQPKEKNYRQVRSSVSTCIISSWWHQYLYQQQLILRVEKAPK
jgi:hypothetical protein